MNLRRLPGRLTSGETAVLIGCHEHDIATLIRSKLLTPLGKPEANSPKYFSSVEILKVSTDTAWLSRMTQTLARYWKNKNSRTSKTL